jgi:hypothetical protein
MRLYSAFALTLLAVAAVPAAAQDRSDATPSRHGIAVGNHPNVSGLRFNFRDRGLQQVRGANFTIWSPYDEPIGTVRGLAFGAPVTAAGSINGIATGLFGVGATHDLTGIGLAPVGIGAGGLLKGIMAGGIGVGAGGDLQGLAIGGIGAGVGGNARGILAGGIGAGAGGDFRGIAAGGIGVGAGGNARGILVGGIGAGVGGDLRGIGVSGVGLGAGGSLRGIGLSIIGIGAGNSIDGLAIAGIGIGAPTIRKVAIASMVGASRMDGLIIAPVLSRLEKGGHMHGASVSAVNAMRGEQRGLTIGIVNYARELDGMQIGVINIAQNSSLKFLPLVNYKRK